MRGMKACGKCKGGDCKGGRNCMREESKGMPVAIMVALPKRGARTATNKAKKK